ncbi:hypothetical protein QBC45DRAFT_411846 [Copromyces sp. CBS 386.78]|nr:hypothetical protein QBC45DRAFT_411846 [Copromyces sp. CBS 386.78]
MGYGEPNPRYQQSMYTINWVRRFGVFMLSASEPPPQSHSQKRHQEGRCEALEKVYEEGRNGKKKNRKK